MQHNFENCQNRQNISKKQPKQRQNPQYAQKIENNEKDKNLMTQNSPIVFISFIQRDFIYPSYTYINIETQIKNISIQLYNNQITLSKYRSEIPMAKSQQLKEYFEQIKIKKLKYQGSTLFRSVQSTIRLILRSLPKDSPRIETVSKVLGKIQLSNSVAACAELDELSNKMLYEARDFMKYMKFGFTELTFKNRQYTKYEDPFMVEYLIEAQNGIQFGEFAQGYERQLLKMREEHEWSEIFVKEWVKKSIEMKENKIELYQKNSSTPAVQAPSDSSFKRNSSTRSAEEETAVSNSQEAPKKKVKTESLSYYVYIMTAKTILKHLSSKKEKSNFQARINEFRQSQDPSVFRALQRQTAKQLFQLRSYYKNFMEASMEIAAQEQYKQYDSCQLANTVLKIQQSIDPNNIFDSYKKIVFEGKLFAQNWPKEMKNKIFVRTIEMKNAETKKITERQRQLV